MYGISILQYCRIFIVLTLDIKFNERQKFLMLYVDNIKKKSSLLVKLIPYPTTNIEFSVYYWKGGAVTIDAHTQQDV